MLFRSQVCVAYNGVKTNCLSWPVVEAAPAVFTVDGVYAAALNQDGTINSADNPAAPGSIVSIFATGLGPISPAQADGTLVGFPLPNNVLPVGVEAQWASGVPFHPGIAAFDVCKRGPVPPGNRRVRRDVCRTRAIPGRRCKPDQLQDCPVSY